MVDPSKRPLNKDFWKLSEVVISQDSRISDPDFTMESELAKICDPETVEYTAIHRAMMMLNVQSKTDLVIYQDMVSKIAAAWTDGFLAGGTFERRYGA